MGQLNNSPVLALPAGDADGATSIGAGWGRGLNDQSGKLAMQGRLRKHENVIRSRCNGEQGGGKKKCREGFNREHEDLFQLSDRV